MLLQLRKLKNRKLSFIDILIIITILLLGILIYRISTQKEQWVSVIIISDSILPVQALSLKSEDYEKNSNNEVIAYIKDVQQIESKNIYSYNPIVANAIIKAVINSRTKNLEFKNRALLTGTNIELNLNSGYIKGQVIKINPDSHSDEIIKKNVTFYLHHQNSKLLKYLDPQNQNPSAGQGILINEVQIINDNNASLSSIDANITFELKASVDCIVISGVPVYQYMTPLIPGNKISFQVNGAIIRDAEIITVE